MKIETSHVIARMKLLLRIATPEKIAQAEGLLKLAMLEEVAAMDVTSDEYLFINKFLTPSEHADQMAADRDAFSRFEVDPYGDILNEYLIGKSRVALRELLEDALEIPKERMSPAVSKRVTSHMARAGWRMDRDAAAFYRETV